MITISRLRTDERTHAFAQRKVASGKSKLEAIRFRGCQYTSYAFGKRCRDAGVMPSTWAPSAMRMLVAGPDPPGGDRRNNSARCWPPTCSWVPVR